MGGLDIERKGKTGKMAREMLHSRPDVSLQLVEDFEALLASLKNDRAEEAEGSGKEFVDAVGNQ
jgi:hypothetical protein